MAKKDHWGQANVFIISCTHSISSTTPDQESTAIFPIQLIRVQSMPYRTWPVPSARRPALAESVRSLCPNLAVLTNWIQSLFSSLTFERERLRLLALNFLSPIEVNHFSQHRKYSRRSVSARGFGFPPPSS